MRRRIGVAAVVVLLCAGTAGCGSNGGSAAPATVTAPQTVTMTVTASTPDGSTADLPTGAPSGEPEQTGGAEVTGLESEGAAVDPCTLVTRADAETLAATKLDPAVKINQTCTYSGPVTGPTAQVQVFVGPGSKKQLDIEKELGHALRKLAGVGDEAYAAEAGVFIRKGTLWASVELVRLNDPAENADRLAHVAKTVASRL